MKKSTMPHPVPESDAGFAETLAEARRGSRQALDELFRRFYPEVSTLVHRRLSRDLRAGRPWLMARFSTGDVVQEVFQGVLHDLRDFHGRTAAAFTAYLAMMARNRLIDAIRYHEANRRDGRCTVQAVDERWHDGAVADPGRRASDREEAWRYRSLLESFPRREQLLLRARIEEGTTFRVLAEMLGYRSEPAARRAFYTTRARLAMGLGRAAR